MKQILFIAAFLFAIAGTVTAQSWAGGVIVTDSTRLTNQHTNIVTLLNSTKGKSSNWQYSVMVVSDSISGSNAGTSYLQVSNDGYTWYNSQTLTLDGATQQKTLYEGVLYAVRMRVYQITPSGTRVTAVRVKAVMRKQ